MAKKKNSGRPSKGEKEKVKVKYIYITDIQEAKIKNGFKTLTLAVLGKCGVM
jgi:hypothetical protein